MDAITFLESQHREVEALFAKIEKQKGRERKATFTEIAKKLQIHTKLEEKLFYPEGKKVDEDMTLEALEEHGVVDMLLAKIKKTPPSDETFLAKVTVLKEVVEHHVEEEEQEYFPECRRALGEEKLEAIGTKMEALHERLAGRSKRAPMKKAA